MCKVIMIGCDLHDATMVLKVADGPGATVRKGFATSNRPGMIEWVKDFASQHGATRIVFAYEASGQGFGLYDDLTEAGIECHVLAPTHLPHTTHSRKNKTDDKDALMILDEVRCTSWRDGRCRTCGSPIIRRAMIGKSFGCGWRWPLNGRGSKTRFAIL